MDCAARFLRNPNLKDFHYLVSGSSQELLKFLWLLSIKRWLFLRIIIFNTKREVIKKNTKLFPRLHKRYPIACQTGENLNLSLNQNSSKPIPFGATRIPYITRTGSHKLIYYKQCVDQLNVSVGATIPFEYSILSKWYSLTRSLYLGFSKHNIAFCVCSRPCFSSFHS